MKNRLTSPGLDRALSALQQSFDVLVGGAFNLPPSGAKRPSPAPPPIVTRNRHSAGGETAHGGGAGDASAANNGGKKKMAAVPGKRPQGATAAGKMALLASGGGDSERQLQPMRQPGGDEPAHDSSAGGAWNGEKGTAPIERPHGGGAGEAAAGGDGGKEK